MHIFSYYLWLPQFTLYFSFFLNESLISNLYQNYACIPINQSWEWQKQRVTLPVVKLMVIKHSVHVDVYHYHCKHRNFHIHFISCCEKFHIFVQKYKCRLRNALLICQIHHFACIFWSFWWGGLLNFELWNVHVFFNVLTI